MDQANLRNMNRICGGDPEGKIHLLMDYTSRPGEVADPWYTGDFETTWQDVLHGLLSALQQLTCKQNAENAKWPAMAWHCIFYGAAQINVPAPHCPGTAA